MRHRLRGLCQGHLKKTYAWVRPLMQAVFNRYAFLKYIKIPPTAVALTPIIVAQVLHASALLRDVRSWPSQENTLIGTKGVTLSGGQR
jgi:hypothetical protein